MRTEILLGASYLPSCDSGSELGWSEGSMCPLNWQPSPNYCSNNRESRIDNIRTCFACTLKDCHSRKFPRFTLNLMTLTVKSISWIWRDEKPTQSVRIWALICQRIKKVQSYKWYSHIILQKNRAKNVADRLKCFHIDDNKAPNKLKLYTNCVHSICASPFFVQVYTRKNVQSA